MGATQFNHGQQALELLEAGLMPDLTDVAETEGGREKVFPPSLPGACTVDGRISCASLGIHAPEWLWLPNTAFEDAGVPVPTNWNGFVAAAPALEAAGRILLAPGNQPWTSNLAFGAMTVAVAGPSVRKAVNLDKDMDAAAGPEIAAVSEAAANARLLAAKSSMQDWNPATILSIALASVNGHALVNRTFKASAVSFIALLFGAFIPHQAMLYPIVIPSREMGLSGTLCGLVLVHRVFGMPILTLLFRNSLASLPEDLCKPARVDGAGFWGIYLRVRLPVRRGDERPGCGHVAGTVGVDPVPAAGFRRGTGAAGPGP